MDNLINHLEIQNFKSIKKLKMDCKRINVLIGKPNVGKSNILEALSLYDLPITHPSPQHKILSEYIRYEKLSNLIYDQDRKKQVFIKSDIGFAGMRFQMNNFNAYDFYSGSDNKVLAGIDKVENTYGNSIEEYFKGIYNKEINQHPNATDYKNNRVSTYYERVHETGGRNTNFPGINRYSPVKKYHFRPNVKFDNHFPLYLTPPYGDNLFSILENNKDIFKECAEFFKEYGLNLLLDLTNDNLDIQKVVGEGVVKIPYSLLADTLQRIIFHIAAIKSNTNSVILFEEPENHSYPSYINKLADAIINDKFNQYFITTHSPYLLTPFIEECPLDEISIFIAQYEKYETKVRALTDEEIKDIMNNGIDLFYNIRAFSE